MRVFAFLALVLLCVLSVYKAQAESVVLPAAQKVGSLEELRTENAKVAAEWFQAVNQDYMSGTVTLADFYEAATAMKDTGLVVAKSKDGRLAVLKKHVEITESMYVKVKARDEAGIVGGGTERLKRSRYVLLCAKIQLEEESAKK